MTESICIRQRMASELCRFLFVGQIAIKMNIGSIRQMRFLPGLLSRLGVAQCKTCVHQHHVRIA